MTAPGFVACTTAVTTANAAGLLNELVGIEGYALTERADDVLLRSAAGVLADGYLDAWDEGRVFSPHAEVRWRRMGASFSLLLLTEDEGTLPSGWQILAGPWMATRHEPSEGVLLWGNRQDGWPHWIEVRIPRPLVYPVSKTTGRVRVGWVDYRDQQGTPRFVRLTEVA